MINGQCVPMVSIWLYKVVGSRDHRQIRITKVESHQKLAEIDNSLELYHTLSNDCGPNRLERINCHFLATLLNPFVNTCDMTYSISNCHLRKVVERDRKPEHKVDLVA